MLNVLVSSRSTPSALALTLSGLVPAVAEGLISHAVVVLAVPDANAERIADAMGATVVTAAALPWQAGASVARSEWLLLLDAGDAPDQGWIGVIERHLMQQGPAGQRPALLPLARGWAAWREWFGHLVTPSRLRAGLLAPRLSVAGGTAIGTTAGKKAGETIRTTSGSIVRLTIGRRRIVS